MTPMRIFAANPKDFDSKFATNVLKSLVPTLTWPVVDSGACLDVRHPRPVNGYVSVDPLDEFTQSASRSEWS